MKVKNSTFRDCFYNEYEKIKEDVLSLVIYSNLLDKDIRKLLEIPYKLSTMLKYFCKKGYIDNVKENRLDDISHPVIVKKYSCDLKNLKLSQNFILYKYLRGDYIELFLKYQKYLFGPYSNSYIYNKLGFKHFKNVLLYMEYLGIINIVEDKQIDITWLNKNSKRKNALKTIVRLNKDFEQNYKLIDKENLDEHSITSSFDGEVVSVSWNKL